MRAAILFPFSFPLLFSQVDERMNKIRYPGEDLRDSVARRICIRITTRPCIHRRLA